MTINQITPMNSANIAHFPIPQVKVIYYGDPDGYFTCFS